MTTKLSSSRSLVSRARRIPRLYVDSRRQKAVNLYEVGRFGIRCTLRALLESINDSTHGEVIRAEFDSNSVSREDTDIVHSHLTADVS